MNSTASKKNELTPYSYINYRECLQGTKREVSGLCRIGSWNRLTARTNRWVFIILCRRLYSSFCCPRWMLSFNLAPDIQRSPWPTIRGRGQFAQIDEKRTKGKPVKTALKRTLLFRPKNLDDRVYGPYASDADPFRAIEKARLLDCLHRPLLRDPNLLLRACIHLRLQNDRGNQKEDRYLYWPSHYGLWIIDYWALQLAWNWLPKFLYFAGPLSHWTFWRHGNNSSYARDD
jgi:hypothetical protein